MSDDENQFVQIPTMTIRKPKKKQAPNRFMILGLVAMGLGIVILAIAAVVLLF